MAAQPQRTTRERSFFDRVLDSKGKPKYSKPLDKVVGDERLKAAEDLLTKMEHTHLLGEIDDHQV